ncbi:MAG: DUF951 domain-containing protein [Firmicutes bacterium]|nr:DUF951 domain-containing protein [Bacillota bacterium]
MIPLQKFSVGDVVRVKKKHPCGSDRWEILRVGMDFRIKCLGCGRIVMMPRVKFERIAREIQSSAVPDPYKS